MATSVSLSTDSAVKPLLNLIPQQTRHPASCRVDLILGSPDSLENYFSDGLLEAVFSNRLRHP